MPPPVETQSLSFTLPMPPRALSPNAGGHHMAKHKVRKQYLAACFDQLIVVRSHARRDGVALPLPAVVEIGLTFYVRTLANDPDNLVAAFKAGIDSLTRNGLIPSDNAKHVRYAPPKVLRAARGTAERVELVLTGGLS